MRTVARLFDHHSDALAAIRDLEHHGVADRDISLVSNNTERWYDERGDRRDDDGDDAASGAAKGAGIGAAVGGAGGLLAGLGMLAIPGIGPVVAAGWLASTAAGAAGGAALGAAGGGLVGALTDNGETEENAQVYAEGVRRGGALIYVRTSEADALEVERILTAHGGVDAEARGADYRAGGWKRYDPDARPYTHEEIAAERARYRGPDETRTFRTEGDAFRDESDPSGGYRSDPATSRPDIGRRL